MDGTTLELPLFLLATFAGALVAGLSGFAFGLVAASIWLYILTPLQTATLIIAFGLIVQGYSVWKLRRALDWKRLWPFVLGAAVGVPVGVTILTWANPAHVRSGVGAFLVLYSLYALFRPTFTPVKAGGATIDAGFSADWRAADALQEAVQVSTLRYVAGKASYFEVLEAQQQLYPTQAELTRALLAEAQAVVQLYRVLGGGWNLADPQWIGPEAPAAAAGTKKP
jgi:uncharacterized membrane protein YfcA